MSLNRRRNSNDGVSGHAERAVPLRQSLIYSVLGATQRQTDTRKRQTLHCDKLAHGAPPVKVPDAMVLHIRALRDFEGLTAGPIAKLTGVPRGAVESLIYCESRAHLQPTHEHLTAPAVSEAAL